MTHPAFQHFSRAAREAVADYDWSSYHWLPPQSEACPIGIAINVDLCGKGVSRFPGVPEAVNAMMFYGLISPESYGRIFDAVWKFMYTFDRLPDANARDRYLGECLGLTLDLPVEAPSVAELVDV